MRVVASSNMDLGTLILGCVNRSDFDLVATRSSLRLFSSTSRRMSVSDSLVGSVEVVKAKAGGPTFEGPGLSGAGPLAVRGFAAASL